MPFSDGLFSGVNRVSALLIAVHSLRIPQSDLAEFVPSHTVPFVAARHFFLHADPPAALYQGTCQWMQPVHEAYESVAEARRGIGAYVTFYNQQRPHQSLARLTPDEVYAGCLNLPEPAW